MKPHSGQETHRRRRLFRKRMREQEGEQEPSRYTTAPAKSRLGAGAILLIIIVVAAIFIIAVKTNFGVTKKENEGCYVINRDGAKEYRPCDEL